jgi:hypothetical protein
MSHARSLTIGNPYSTHQSRMETLVSAVELPQGLVFRGQAKTIQAEGQTVGRPYSQRIIAIQFP